MRRCTPQEKIMKQMLKSLNVKFKFQFIIPYNHSFIISDFFIPLYNIVIECDGWQHHIPEMIEKDRKRDAYLLESLGIETLRLDNMIINNKSYTKKIVKQFLEKIKNKQVKLI